MSPARTCLYWACAGEVMTLGGPLRLAAPDYAPTAGCRPITLPRAAELWTFYVLKARACTDRAARRHCRACADELQAAIHDAGRWRRAA